MSDLARVGIDLGKHTSHLHIRIAAAKLRLRMLRLALADQAPRADKFEKYINT